PAFAAVYRQHFAFLRDLARYRFNVPPSAAEDVVQEVFLGYLLARESVRDPRAWLIGGVCNASRHYWTVQGRRRDQVVNWQARNPGTDEFLQAITVRQVVGRLHSKCRRTLELHYWEGATGREVAEQLGTTLRYAEKLIHQCLRKAFRAWHHLWSE
ncbi:MAG TPA: sigma-70 family RNA polymerase sigma factor, partial [Thermoanaerobaculia bacterium]|nr:sigma-70 family RNA polymerase sigma factor [Thermoanaerobaculia bacterium]